MNDGLMKMEESEIKTEIKDEIKTEEEELRGKTGGFHCAECSAHFFYEEYFLEHIRELHLPSKLSKVAADNHVQRISTAQTTPTKNESSSHVKQSAVEELLQQSTQEENDENRQTATRFSSNSDNNLFTEHVKVNSFNRILSREFKCSICPYSSNSISDIMNHVSYHTGSIRFKCSECNNLYKSVKNLIEHRKECHPDLPSKKLKPSDDQYQKTMTETTSIKNESSFHVKHIASPAKPAFKQSTPDVIDVDQQTKTQSSSDSGDNLFIELDTAIDTDAKKYKCSICPYSSDQLFDIETHVSYHAGSRRFKCSLCVCSFKSRENLLKHKRSHSDDDKPSFKCSECTYKASKRYYLKAHQLIHSNYRPFKCSECSYTTQSSTRLAGHRKMHSQYKPFKCTICSYAARTKCRLKRHLIIHTNEYPFKCTECSFAARVKGNLMEHRRIHDADSKNLFKCKDCSFATRWKGCLRRHKLIHENKKPHACLVCPYAARQKNTLKTHMLIHAKEKPGLIV